MRGGVFQAQTPAVFRPLRGETEIPASSRVEIVFENDGHILMLGLAWHFNTSEGTGGEEAYRQQKR